MYSQRNKEYYEKNKETILLKKKIYNKEKSEIRKEKARLYRQTPQGKKNEAINKWKQRGVLDNFNNKYSTLYKIYQSTKYCDDCGFDLINKKRKCLDHCHITGYFRGIVCNSCNNKRK